MENESVGAPKLASQTEMMIEDQNKAISILHDVVSQLGNRLSGVMRQFEKPEESSDGKDEPSLVALAEKLKNHNLAIRNAAGIIREYIERLEL